MSVPCLPVLGQVSPALGCSALELFLMALLDAKQSTRGPLPGQKIGGGSRGGGGGRGGGRGQEEEMLALGRGSQGKVEEE